MLDLDILITLRKRGVLDASEDPFVSDDKGILAVNLSTDNATEQGQDDGSDE